jgi:hypothetical protein
MIMVMRQQQEQRREMSQSCWGTARRTIATLANEPDRYPIRRDQLIPTRRAQSSTNGIGHGLTGIDIGNQLWLALSSQATKLV